MVIFYQKELILSPSQGLFNLLLGDCVPLFNTSLHSPRMTILRIQSKILWMKSIYPRLPLHFRI
jgi:hypothetical protein